MSKASVLWATRGWNKIIIEWLRQRGRHSCSRLRSLRRMPPHVWLPLTCWRIHCVGGQTLGQRQILQSRNEETWLWYRCERNTHHADHARRSDTCATIQPRTFWERCVRHVHRIPDCSKRQGAHPCDDLSFTRPRWFGSGLGSVCKWEEVGSYKVGYSKQKCPAIRAFLFYQNFKDAEALSRHVVYLQKSHFVQWDSQIITLVFVKTVDKPGRQSIPIMTPNWIVNWTSIFSFLSRLWTNHLNSCSDCHSLDLYKSIPHNIILVMSNLSSDSRSLISASGLGGRSEQIKHHHIWQTMTNFVFQVFKPVSIS